MPRGGRSKRREEIWEGGDETEERVHITLERRRETNTDSLESLETIDIVCLGQRQSKNM